MMYEGAYWFNYVWPWILGLFIFLIVVAVTIIIVVSVNGKKRQTTAPAPPTHVQPLSSADQHRVDHEKLVNLEDLRKQGIISQEEFDKKKAEILERM